MSDAVYIIDGARTPMGGLMGELSALSGESWRSRYPFSAEKSNLSGGDIDEVIMGCVLPSGSVKDLQTSCHRRRYTRQRRRHHDQ